jgi:RNA polymerase sigma factor for flagellar operon FliA|nr:RNA polymerase sigma factor FliA [Kofleriaceae bacterium]
MNAYARKQTRNPERDRLIAEHVDVARRIALRLARRCPDWVTREDLVAAGLLGLTEAAERYDDSRNEPFLGFATKRIRGAVLDELRRGDIMPRRVRTLARAVGATIARLERELGTSPTDEQVAAAMGVTLEDYRKNLEELVHVTVGAVELDDGDLVTGAESSPEENAGKRLAIARVRQALANLDQRDITLLSLYYNEELLYSEIAEVLGVTVSRVSQLHGRAIARLRTEMERISGVALEAA